jgi:hypothetical protein
LDINLTNLAQELAEEEHPELLPKTPGHKMVQKTASLTAFAQGVRALDLRTKEGLTWAQVAERMGLRNASSAYSLASRARVKLDVESKVDKRFIQRQRLERMYIALEPKIAAGRERAVEVAVKILEREARLEGLDLDGQTQEGNRQAIVINVQPHPDDIEARKFVIEHQPKLLPAPIEGVSLEEEIHSSDRGNGSGEDLVRPVLDSETSDGAR